MEKIFFDEFKTLCEKYGLAIASEDPFCGLEIVPYDDEMKEYYSNYWEE